MPLYEYECEECGQIREAFQKFSDVPLKECSCCSGKLRKLISNSAFHLKGGGWYASGYESSSAKNKPHKTGNSDKNSDKSNKKEKKNSVKATA